MCHLFGREAGPRCTYGGAFVTCDAVGDRTPILPHPVSPVQFAEALTIISKSDFPGKWSNLIPDLVSLIKSSGQVCVLCVGGVAQGVKFSNEMDEKPP